MAGRLQLRLFGNPEVNLAGAVVTGALAAKAQAILYYLAVTGQPQPRSTLASLLWGDAPESAARANLRKALANLRQVVGDYLDLEGQTVAFSSDRPYWVDVVEFVAGVEEISPTGDPKRLQEAVALYRGDFLAGFYVREALDFETWMLAEQAWLRELVIQALHTLAVHHAEQGELAQGIGAVRRLLSLEPWREEAHRQLMWLLAQTGQRSAALAQYETCRQALAEELGVEPGPETIKLYERIREGRLGGGAEEQRNKREIPISTHPHRPPAPLHNLPPPLTSFVGRQQELVDIHQRINDPDCRLLTLTGPGGIGKTRLALEAARQYTEPDRVLGELAFPDGVFFVNLAPVELTEMATSGPARYNQVSNFLAAAVAEALNFSFHSATDVWEQLLAYVCDKKLLLIVDNFEHLVMQAELLVTLLRRTPGLKLLVTSRERLNLQEEWVLAVEGLTYPLEEEPGGSIAGWQLAESSHPYPSNLPTLQPPSHYSAMTLFIQRAQQAQGRFTLSEEVTPAIIRICQLVEGVPLALELAASWLSTLSCIEIAAEIERNLNILKTPLRNVPERHRSLRAVFEHSWHMLTNSEQSTLGKLSVFRGGFQREAAQRVAGASLPMLTGLIHKSLLRLTASGRYEMHELLQQYAAEKFLIEQGDEPPTSQAQRVQVTWQRYSTYYLNFVKGLEGRLRGRRPQQALAELQRELDNIRQAWRWAVMEGQLEDIRAGLSGLARFYEMAGLFEEGGATFALAADQLHHRLATFEVSNQELQIVLGKLLVEQARFLTRRGLSEPALQLISTALDLAEATGVLDLKAQAYLQQSDTFIFMGENILAQAPLEQALPLVRAAHLPEIEAEVLRNLGIYYQVQGNYDQAITILEQALALYRRLEDQSGLGMVLMNLANTAVEQRQYAQAREWFMEALQIFREIEYPLGEALILNNMAYAGYEQGHYSQAQAHCLQSLQITRSVKAPVNEVHTLHTLSNILRDQGAYAEARNFYEQCLHLAREVRMKITESYALADLGLLCHHLGDHEGACEYNQQALQIAQEAGARMVQVLALTHLGHALAALGQTNEAARAYQQALDLCRELGKQREAVTILAGFIQLYLAQDNLAQAQTEVELILPELTSDNLPGMEEPFRVYWTCYQVLRASQDSRAQVVLQQAYHLLQERAANIEDENLRHSFLENVPPHWEIVRGFQHAHA